MSGLSITALERGVRALAKRLDAQGFTTKVDSFRTGPGGDAHYGPSYVTLRVEVPCFNRYGQPDNAWHGVKFIAGGYWARHGDVGGDKWSVMAEEGLKLIAAELWRLGYTGRPPTMRASKKVTT